MVSESIPAETGRRQTHPEFVGAGGFVRDVLGHDSFDIAVAADGVDICERMYDGDPGHPRAQEKLNYEKTLAFTNFHLVRDPYTYEFSDIDNNPGPRAASGQRLLWPYLNFPPNGIPSLPCSPRITRK